MAMDPNIKTIDQYIARYPKDVQAKLEKIRLTIHKAAPEAQEKISYGLATFTYHGNLVHFGAYDTHIGFYPGSIGVSMFKDELKDYDTSTGTIRFPLDKPVPYDLIKKITRACAAARTKQQL
jgi:uncharacterized protein YdhG (YjbR/CyaY superfamily)